MGLPGTLAGIVGMIIFIIFMIGISASDIFPDESQKVRIAQEDFTNALNRSTSSVNSTSEVGFVSKLLGAVGLDGIYDFIRNFLSMLVAFIVMVVQYLLLFIGITTILPSEFYVFFALISSGLIIAIIKLVFLSGD